MNKFMSLLAFLFAWGYIASLFVLISELGFFVGLISFFAIGLVLSTLYSMITSPKSSTRTSNTSDVQSIKPEKPKNSNSETNLIKPESIEKPYVQKYDDKYYEV